MSAADDTGATLMDLAPQAASAAGRGSGRGRGRAKKNNRGSTSVGVAVGEASNDDDIVLSACGKRAGERPRYDDRPPLLREVVIGFREEEADPVQEETVHNANSAEITSMVKKGQRVPIDKNERGKWVWVALSQDNGGTKKFTTDAEATMRTPEYAHSDHTCDVCGKTCKDLTEFRSYVKKSDSRGERRLDPAIAYVGTVCGKALLGKRMPKRVFNETLQQILDSKDSAKEMEAFLANASATARAQVEDELRRLTGLNNAKASSLQEFWQAQENKEWNVGELHKQGEDPFRALGRSMALGMGMGHKLVAAASIVALQEAGKDISGGYMSSVLEALQKDRPLPIPPSPWHFDEVRHVLGLITEAWPFKVELYSTLHDREEFVKKDKPGTSVFKLVYLSGTGSLHGPAQFGEMDKDAKQKIVSKMTPYIEKARSLYHTTGTSPIFATKEDKAISVPNKPSNDDVLKALMGITWPDNTSRNNVRPEGQDSIKAFMLGMVMSYNCGLCLSRNCRKRPNLSQLLTKYISVSHPDFCYTSIQLNKDYNARMHVDGNNHGWSYIIGLGNYEGGTLWHYHKDGNVHKEITEKMRGWQGFLGMTLPGFEVDIKNKWVMFDGTLPHVAMPFTGTRISLVYFSRKAYGKAQPAVQSQLRDLGVPFPDETWYAKGQGVADQGPQDEAARVAVKGVIVDLKAEETELIEDSDSDVEVDEGHDAQGLEEVEKTILSWSTLMQDTLGVEWKKNKGKVSLSVINGGLGPGATFALKEILPAGKVETVSLIEDELDYKESKANVKNMLKFAQTCTSPKIAFASLKEFTKGKGFDEVTHTANVSVPAEREDILFASFSIQDKELRSLQAVVSQIQKRQLQFRPHLVIFEARDWESVHTTMQKQTLRKVIDDTGLRNIPGVTQGSRYHLDFFEVTLQDFIPVSGSRLYILLGTDKEDLGDAVKIMKLLATKVQQQRWSFQDVMLDASDPNVERVRESWRRIKASSLSSMSEKDKASIDKMRQREKGYLMHMKNEEGDEFVDNWFPHAQYKQLETLHKAYAKARDAKGDLRNVVVDLSPLSQSRGTALECWRDDGLLPTSQSSINYSVKQHRLLTGLEELLCRGLPASKMLSQKYFTDGDLRPHALTVTPLPVVGTILGALLSVVQLPPQKTQKDSAPPPRLSQERRQLLLDEVNKLPPVSNALTMESVYAEDEASARPGDQISIRAVALLNFISNQGKDAQEGKEVVKPTETQLTKKLKQAASQVGDTSRPEALIEEEAVNISEAKGPENLRSWAKRADLIKNFHCPIDDATSKKLNNYITFEMAMKWIIEAADEYDGTLGTTTTNIVEYGCQFLELVLDLKVEDGEDRAKLNAKKGTSTQSASKLSVLQKYYDKKDEKEGDSDGLKSQLKQLHQSKQADKLLTRFVQSLEMTSVANRARDIARAARECLFLWAHVPAKTAFPDGDLPQSFFEDVMLSLKNRDSRRAFLELLEKHMGKGYSWKCSLFMDEGEGLALICQWLREDALMLFSKSEWAHRLQESPLWPNGWTTMTALAQHSDERVPGLLRSLLHIQMPEGSPQAKEVRDLHETVCLVMLKQIVNNAQPVRKENLIKVLSDFKEAPSHAFGELFRACEELLLFDAEQINQSGRQWEDVRLLLGQRKQTVDGANLKAKFKSKDAQTWFRKLEELEAQWYAKQDTVVKDELKKEYERDREERRIKAEKAADQLTQSYKDSLSSARQKLQESLDGKGFKITDEKEDNDSLDGINEDELAEIQKHLADLLQLERKVRTRMKKPGEQEQGIDEEIDKLAKAVAKAVKHWSQKPARLKSIKVKLRSSGVDGHFVEILAASSLLESLNEISNDGDLSEGDSSKLSGLGLPAEVRCLVVGAAKRKIFANVEPQVPPGYSTRISTSSGLEFLYNQRTQQSCWQWPGESVDQFAPFVAPQCPAKVDDIAYNHRHLNLWQDLVGCLQTQHQMLRDELRSAQNASNSFIAPENLIHKAWLQNLWQHILKCTKKAKADPKAAEAWWHKVVDYNNYAPAGGAPLGEEYELSVATELQVLEQGFENMLQVAEELVEAAKELLEEHLEQQEQLEEERKRKPEPEPAVLEQGRGSPKKQARANFRPVPAAAPAQQSVRSTPLGNEPQSEMRIPTPGVDFPWLPKGHDGIIVEGGKEMCYICQDDEDGKPLDISNQGREIHLATKRHVGYRDQFWYVLDELAKTGHTLAKEGICFQDRAFSCMCKPGKKAEAWYKVFEHKDNQYHKKYAASYSRGLPAGYEDRWKEAFAQADQEFASEAPKPTEAAPQAVRTADKKEAAEQPSPSKKARTEEPKSAPSATAEQTSKSSDPSRASVHRLPAKAGGYKDKPSREYIGQAQAAAENRWCPNLPLGPLVWGFFKKPDVWVWCTECNIYPAIVSFNAQTSPPLCEVTRDGVCAHWDAEAADDYKQQLWSVMAKNGITPPSGFKRQAPAESPAASQPKKPRGTASGEAPPSSAASSSAASSSRPAAASAASSSSVSSTARPAKGAMGCSDKPDAKGFSDAATAAGNRHCPAHPGDDIKFGYFHKPYLWLWCTKCQIWVSLVEFNSATGKCQVDHGACPHYNGAEYEQRLTKQMKSWGW